MATYNTTADENGNAVLQIDDIGTYYVNALIDDGVTTAISETKLIEIRQSNTSQSITLNFATIAVKTLIGITINATNGVDSFSFVTTSDTIKLYVNLGNWVLSSTIDGVTKTSYVTVDEYKEYSCSLPALVVTRTMDFQAGTSVLDTSEGTIEDLFPFVGRRRCNLADDGTINAWYGDADYVEDGSNGQCMVYQPKFWYKMTPITLEDNVKIRKASWSISDTKIDGYKLHPAFYDEDGNEVDYILIGTFEGCVYDVSEGKYLTGDSGTYNFTKVTGDRLSSIANALATSAGYKSLRVYSIDNCRNIAENRGDGWHQNNIRVASLNQMMMIIEYGGNMQTLVAPGVVNISYYNNYYYNDSVKTGSTNSIGNGTGRASSSTGYQNGSSQYAYTETVKTSVCYRGMENPWGNLWEFVDGINMYNTQPYIATDYNWETNKITDNYVSCGFSAPDGYNKYISAFGYNETYDWLFISVEGEGTDSNMIGDSQSASASYTYNRGVRIGGSFGDRNNAGPFSLSLASTDSYYRSFGARITYVPQTKRS